VYIDENLLEKNKQATTARKFIEEQLTTLENKLTQTEERLRAFGNEVKGIRISPSIQNKLTELEFTLLDLMQKYTAKHPSVKQVKDQIGDLEAQLKGFSGQELEYARLARDAEVNTKLHAMLKEKLEEARITEAQKVSDVSLVNPAIFPTAPIGQEKKTGVMLGGLTGIVFGIILAFVIESLDTSIGTIEDVEALLKLPVLGVVPSVKIESKKKSNIVNELLGMFSPHAQSKTENTYARLIVHYEPKSFIAEAYRSIRTNLKLCNSMKTILITSANPQEGKTTVLTNLSLAIAQGGAKTLVVSTDLRRPVIARTFGLKEEPGINEVVTKVVALDSALRSISDIMLGDMKLDNIMETPGMENISILSSGRIPMNPSELLESRQMHTLIDELKSRFDVVIFDSPPVLPITDAVLLAAHVDGVVLVYEAGRTARSALLRTKAQLESAGAKILGVVLNHIKPETEAAVNYPNYRRYKYYGEESDRASKKKS
jgi:tyrosine-protein kinase Etk/Wzc